MLSIRVKGQIVCAVDDVGFELGLETFDSLKGALSKFLYSFR